MKTCGESGRWAMPYPLEVDAATAPLPVAIAGGLRSSRTTGFIHCLVSVHRGCLRYSGGGNCRGQRRRREAFIQKLHGHVLCQNSQALAADTADSLAPICLTLPLPPWMTSPR